MHSATLLVSNPPPSPASVVCGHCQAPCFFAGCPVLQRPKQPCDGLAPRPASRAPQLRVDDRTLVDVPTSRNRRSWWFSAKVSTRQQSHFHPSCSSTERSGLVKPALEATASAIASIMVSDFRRTCCNFCLHAFPIFDSCSCAWLRPVATEGHRKLSQQRMCADRASSCGGPNPNFVSNFFGRGVARMRTQANARTQTGPCSTSTRREGRCRNASIAGRCASRARRMSSATAARRHTSACT